MGLFCSQGLKGVRYLPTFHSSIGSDTQASYSGSARQCISAELWLLSFVRALHGTYVNPTYRIWIRHPGCSTGKRLLLLPTQFLISKTMKGTITVW